MRVARLSLIACSLLTCAYAAFANAPAPAPVAAMPLSSPGGWLGADDYPAPALRYDMTGITVFKLTVDPTGNPSRCDIVESSGFDILDRATCQRVMANARFSPARDRMGKPIEGTFTNRVRWTMPPGATVPVSERLVSALLSIDQAGKVTSCRFVFHVPIEAPASAENPCRQAQRSLPPALGLEFRGSFAGPLADVETQLADVFTPAMRARVLAPMPGYEQRGLNVYHFTVTRDGKVGQCNYEEQRGSDVMAADFCGEARRYTYDPPFAAFDKDGVANGWHIQRVMLRQAQ